jgi:hypothetical protein
VSGFWECDELEELLYRLVAADMRGLAYKLPGVIIRRKPARFAAEHYRVRVTSINISEEQMRIARERCSGFDVEIARSDYRDVRGTFLRSVGRHRAPSLACGRRAPRPDDRTG